MIEKKTLVTGATGFIGAYLLHWLVSNGATNIRATKRPGSPMDLVAAIADKVEWVDADLLDTPALEEAVRGISHIYHCAAVVSFSETDARQMIRVNQKGTANVVNIALDEGVEKLIHVSSIAAIGREKKQSVIDENTKWQDSSWNTPYAISKHKAEMEVWRGMAEGLNAVIVNPSNVLGSGFWKGRTATGQFFYKMWNGLRFYPTGSSGFVDVRDVARFMAMAMDSEITGERFILNGENLPFKTVLDEIASVLEVNKPSIKVTPLIRETAWRAGWLLSKVTGKTPFITKQTARASARCFSYKNQKSLSAFPFEYTPISETIRETAEQFLVAAKEGFTPKVLPF